ncbi:nuclear transport factor 2 family protein [Streptomyces sp. NPDC001220]
MSDKALLERIVAVEDRLAIIDVLCRYAVSIDRHRWDDFASCFADEIDLNVIRTRRWVRWERDKLLQTVRRVFESYTATQHISANHQITIEGDEAVAWSTLNATHYIKDFPGGEFQQQVGYYEYHLVRDQGWRITKVRQVEHWQRGNQHIFDRTVE